MLAPWHEFYALLGTAAAALVALLFVAVSIGASVISPENSRATSTYLSPVVFHYTNILFLGLIALFPGQTWESFGLTIAVAAAGSLVYSIVIFVRLMRASVQYLSDWFAYGIVPVAAYGTGLVSSYLLLQHSETALDVLGASALLLLVVNIRNAWDLMLALALKATEKARNG
jgi:hypothetical protein